MAYNQTPYQTQATPSPTLHVVTNPQMMNPSHLNNQQSQPANPNNQPPTGSIPNPSTLTDQLSLEFNQLSFDITNQRANVQDFLLAQHLETVNAILNEQTNQDTLVRNYVSRLLGLVQEKEQALATVLHTNSALQRHVAEMEATMASLKQRLEMIQRNDQMVIAGEGDAGSSSGDGMLDKNCQMCHKQPSSVLVVPCNHLCCCLDCKGLLHICPVCATVKQSLVEVVWPRIKKQQTD